MDNGTPKAFFAILGKELPDKSDTLDKNSDTFWEKASKLQLFYGKTPQKIRHIFSKTSQLPDTSKKKKAFGYKAMYYIENFG